MAPSLEDSQCRQARSDQTFLTEQVMVRTRPRHVTFLVKGLSLHGFLEAPGSEEGCVSCVGETGWRRSLRAICLADLISLLCFN